MANLAVGRWLAFYQGDWTRALPHLAAGSNAKLKQLAELELAEPTTDEELTQLGDGWWQQAATLSGPAQYHLRERAVFWYRRLLVTATEDLRKRLEERIEQFDEQEASR